MSHAREARGEDMVVRGISSASIEEASVASFGEKELTEVGGGQLGAIIGNRHWTGSQHQIQNSSAVATDKVRRMLQACYPDELRSMHGKLFKYIRSSEITERPNGKPQSESSDTTNWS